MPKIMVKALSEIVATLSRSGGNCHAWQPFDPIIAERRAKLREGPPSRPLLPCPPADAL
jgi:hypothetical protein